MRDFNPSGPVTAFEKKVNEYRATHPTVDQGTAIHIVSEQYPELADSHRREVLDAVEQHTNARGIAPAAHALSSTPAVQANPDVIRFENLVQQAKTADPKLDTASAMQKVAREQPELAKARNLALSVPVHGGYTGSMI